LAGLVLAGFPRLEVIELAEVQHAGAKCHTPPLGDDILAAIEEAELAAETAFEAEFWQNFRSACRRRAGDTSGEAEAQPDSAPR
jgi:hypothetical protein